MLIVWEAGDWTLTWDVFKLFPNCYSFNPYQYWTLTWDVFK